MDFSRLNIRASRVASKYSAIAASLAIVSGLALALAVGGVNKLFAQTYLFGWSILFSATMGSLLVLVLHSMLTSNWGRLFQGYLEVSSGAKAILLAAVTFVPVILMMDKIYYKWIFPGDDQVVLHKTPFLNTSSWILRALVYFALFVGLTLLLNRKVKGSGTTNPSKQKVAAVGAVVLVLVISLLSVDWYMSIEPHWFSTIYGVWLISGYVLTGLSLMTLAIFASMDKGSLSQLNSTSIPKDIGNLLLAFTMFWAYISLSQYLIIWSGNLPEFNTFYIARQTEGWESLGLVLILGHFLIPFMLLLSPNIKRNFGAVAMVALWILVMRLVDMYWNIAPLYGKSYFSDVRFLVAHLSSAVLFVSLWTLLLAQTVEKRGLYNIEAVGGG